MILFKTKISIKPYIFEIIYLKMKICLISITIILVFLFSCKKESFNTASDVKLEFSTDTLLFDTIFTGFGTSTKRLMVYNPYGEALKISNIRLAGGDDSPYIININGAEKEANNVIIEPNDSMYIFVQIIAKANGSDLPVILKDSVLFNTNGSLQNVKLISYAQDVNLLRDTVIQTQTWSGKKPYLIYDTLIVDSANTLYINPGVTVYLHRNASIIVKGNIQAVGSFYEPIVFRQDRFEDLYFDIPGQWGGIYIIPGTGSHRLEWVTIKNGTTGLQIGNYQNNNPVTIDMSNVIIRDMSYACLIAYRTNIYATNCLIANARNYTCALDAGGSFQFYHSTIANYYNNNQYDSRKNNIPTLYISNYLEKLDTPNQYDYYDITGSFFNNCIIYGDYSNELKLDLKPEAASDLFFDNCIIRKSNTIEYTNKFIDVTWDSDPKFKETVKYFNDHYLSFELDTLSPAKDAGKLEWGSVVPYDLNNKSRMNDKGPDIGAFERIEKK
jgi:hypothetical protein